MSPDASADDERLQSSSQQQPSSNLHHMSYSPDQLSISPYHTTLETSALPTTLENSHTTFEPPTHVVSNLASTVSGSLPLNTNFLNTGSIAIAQVNQSNTLAPHTQRSPLPAYSTVQPANTPVVSSVSPLVTSFRAPPGPFVVPSVPSRTAVTNVHVHVTQPIGSGNNVVTSLPRYSLAAPYPTVGNSLVQTGYQPVSSLAQPFFTNKHSTAGTANVQGQIDDERLSESPERGPHATHGVTMYSTTTTTTTTTVDHSTIQASHKVDTTLPSPSQLRHKYSPLSIGTSPQINSVIVSDIANTSRSTEEAGQTVQDTCTSLHLQPMTNDSSSHVLDETSQSTQPEVIDTTNHDPKHSQLSILTLETTQNSFSEPQPSFSGETEHSIIQQSTVQHHSSMELTHHNRSEIETRSHVEGSSVSHKTGCGSDGTNMYQILLDTIDESDSEYIEPDGDVTNSDSFRGERVQEDTLLEANSSDQTYLPPETLQESTQQLEPTVVTMHMSPPPSNQDNETNQTSILKLKDVHSASIATPYSPTTIFGTKTIQSPATALTPMSGDSDLTLQQAFLRRKRRFVQNSQQRLQQIKASLEEKKAQEVNKHKPLSNFTHSTPIAAKGVSKPKSTYSSPHGRNMESGRSVYDSGIGTGPDVAKKRVVTFSSPLLKQQNGVGTSSQHTGVFHNS